MISLGHFAGKLEAAFVVLLLLSARNCANVFFFGWLLIVASVREASGGRRV